MMALALQQRTDVVRSSVPLVSWRMDESEETSFPAPASIVQAFDDAGGGLLILGAPGAGKSTLLRELASELLIRAEDDPTQPIPVNVNLSSWAIKRSPLMAWMVDRLWETYNIPPHLSQALIKQNQLLFLLDGLDEVELSARSGCIEAINAYRAEHFVPLVVCSRSHEYIEQGERLRLSVAVEVRPLTSEQVDSYLKGAGKLTAAVRAALRSNATLRDLVKTPLMLSIVALTYRGKTANDLPQLGSAEDQQRQVFEHYVTRMLEQRTRNWHYAPHKTHLWLIWLAQQMKQHNLTEFYLERLQPTWLPTKRSQILYGVLCGLFFLGLPTGLVGTLVGTLLGDLLRGLNGGLIGALFFLLVGMLVGGLLHKGWKLDQVIRPTEMLKWSWKNAKPWLFIGPIFGLAIGLTGGLAFKLPGGLIFALVLALAIALIGGLSGEQINEDMRVHPNQGTRSSGWNALRIGLISVLVGAPAGGFIGGPISMLVVGLAFGLLGGLVFGGTAYLAHYVLRFLLWRNGAIPWHYVRFLEEATERILLQRVGGGYRFIHPLFLDYFASIAKPAPSHSAEKPSSPQP